MPTGGRLLTCRAAASCAWGRLAAIGSCGQALLVHNIRTEALGASTDLATLDSWRSTTHPEHGRTAGPVIGPLRGRRDVSGAQGSSTGGRPADVVAPRSRGLARSALRAALRVAPAGPA